MPYYLGIDGGGSKTTCAVGDATSLLATASAGPSNVIRVGEARARESLRQAVRQACGAAGISVQQIERVCVGAAGAGRDKTASLVRKILAEILNVEFPGQVLSGRIVSQPVLPSQIDVVGDTQIALEAAFGLGPGVVVIAGTGSVAYGRDRHGKIARAGGWGFAVSDEGSAHWIGRAALSALLRSIDQRNDQDTDQGENNYPPLLRDLIGVWHLSSLEQLVRTANFHGESATAGSAPDFAAFVPKVVSASEAGDMLSQRVLTAAASELAQLADIVMHHLFPEQHRSASSAVPMAMTGGVFRYSAIVREVFYNEVRQAHPGVILNSEVVEPVQGALQMARRIAS